MITIEGDTLSRMLRTTIPVASWNRPNCCGVFIQTAAGHLHVVATDGHRLHWAQKQIVEGDVPDSYITIPAAEEIRKLLRGDENRYRIGMIDRSTLDTPKGHPLNQNKFVIISEVTEKTVFETDLQSEKFAKFRNVVPARIEYGGVNIIGLNPDYFLDSLSVIKYAARPIPAKLLKKGDRQNFARCRLQLGVSDLDPIRIDAGGHGLLFDLTCIVMPMRS